MLFTYEEAIELLKRDLILAIILVTLSIVIIFSMIILLLNGYR